jgi:hypothetical protein
MQAMQELYPRATVQGIEPSHYNSKVAREKGFMVYETRAGGVGPDLKCDLVYSNNVLQHVTDPLDFMLKQKALLAPDREPNERAEFSAHDSFERLRLRRDDVHVQATRAQRDESNQATGQTRE